MRTSRLVGAPVQRVVGRRQLINQTAPSLSLAAVELDHFSDRRGLPLSQNSRRQLHRVTTGLIQPKTCKVVVRLGSCFCRDTNWHHSPDYNLVRGSGERDISRDEFQAKVAVSLPRHFNYYKHGGGPVFVMHWRVPKLWRGIRWTMIIFSRVLFGKRSFVLVEELRFHRDDLVRACLRIWS